MTFLVMDIYNQEGLFGFSRGLLSYIFIHYLYAFVWKTTDEYSNYFLNGIYGEDILFGTYPR